jgi:hypothetical protein
LKLRVLFAVFAIFLFIFGYFQLVSSPEKAESHSINLPSSKMLIVPAPGRPWPTNSFPTVAALSPNGRYLAVLNNGYGTKQSSFQQSIAILDLNSHKVTDFPDARLGQNARQTYYMGLAFGRDGTELYASIASLTDPTGKLPSDTGNGIAVYTFHQGRLRPERFIKVPLAPLAHGKKSIADRWGAPKGMSIPYPAGLSVLPGNGNERLLVAENLADDAILLDVENGKVLQRFPLSTARVVPAAFPYGVIATRGGKIGFCSLWNASAVAQLNLETGRVVRRIPLLAPPSPVAPGSHPTAMLLSPDQRYLYVTLTNSDRVAVVDVERGEIVGLLSTELPEQRYGGSYPDALAQTADGKRLFVADASADAVAVFDTSDLAAHRPSVSTPQRPLGFLPTEWYPTALAIQGDDLMIVTGKGEGTGPSAGPLVNLHGKGVTNYEGKHFYIPTLIHGSIAVVNISHVLSHLAQLTHEVELSNLMLAKPKENILFKGRKNPIHHVIYIIKENRTYDQVFGDLKPGNGDPSLCMFGENVTPNEHELAKQFGIIDNFYCSGEVSGDGHVWSTAAITSDYNEKTWEIGYRGDQRTYDFEGVVLNHTPLAEGISDVDEPGTAYIWTNVARHGLTHRNYGEFVETHWCDRGTSTASPRSGTPLGSRGACHQKEVRPGQPLPPNVGEPHGSPSLWPWPIPMVATDEATMPALEGHFDPKFPDFRLDYPDQLRVDEFLNEFDEFVRARRSGHGQHLSQFIILRLGNDHTAGTTSGIVDRDFYTTVSMVRTIEELLGLPPMNNNDALAPVMAPLFSGHGNQPPFTANYRNRDNRLIYQMNSPKAPGAKESKRMDFVHADQANAAELNRILWRDRMGNVPMPKPRHVAFP